MFESTHDSTIIFGQVDISIQVEGHFGLVLFRKGKRNLTFVGQRIEMKRGTQIR
jgi:hypothetical protein